MKNAETSILILSLMLVNDICYSEIWISGKIGLFFRRCYGFQFWLGRIGSLFSWLIL